VDPASVAAKSLEAAQALEHAREDAQEDSLDETPLEESDPV
jgi:hypothetical protein